MDGLRERAEELRSEWQDMMKCFPGMTRQRFIAEGRVIVNELLDSLSVDQRYYLINTGAFDAVICGYVLEALTDAEVSEPVRQSVLEKLRVCLCEMSARGAENSWRGWQNRMQKKGAAV